MSTTEFEDYETMITYVKSNNLMIIKFYADWCKPCKEIKPKYNELSNKYSTVKFTKMNIEKLDDTELDILNINKFPTFIMTKPDINDGKIEKIRYQGSDINELVHILDKYSTI